MSLTREEFKTNLLDITSNTPYTISVMDFLVLYPAGLTSVLGFCHEYHLGIRPFTSPNLASVGLEFFKLTSKKNPRMTLNDINVGYPRPSRDLGNITESSRLHQNLRHPPADAVATATTNSLTAVAATQHFHPTARPTTN